MKPRLFFILIICLLTALNTLAQNNAFIVDAKQEWQATGITINSGEGFTITGKGTYADGTGGLLGNPNAWASPVGRSNQDFSGATGLLAPNFPFAALIGKIGSNGEPFGIGSYLFKTATTSGELYLSVNDVAGTFGDNYGYLAANISVDSLYQNFPINNRFPNLELATMKEATAGTGVFIVNARQEWQATGITISNGETFTITGKGAYADGTGGISGNTNAWASPDGRSNQDFSGYNSGFLAPNFPFAALIGKIGSSGEPFGIGSYLFKTATTSGELYLSVNDVGGTFGDNYGYLVAIFSSISVTLPVELTTFTAQVSGNNVLLEWISATEVNNYGFEIERKTSTDWIKIGFAEGYGNSTTLKSYSFTDKEPNGGSRFKYRLKQIDFNGNYKYSKTVEVEIIPNEYSLFQNFPNPFNPNTTIRYSISSPEFVSIKISDVSGQLVKEINKEHNQAGVFEVIWDGTNNLGDRVSSGAYFYQLSVNNLSEAKKMILLK